QGDRRRTGMGALEYLIEARSRSQLRSPCRAHISTRPDPLLAHVADLHRWAGWVLGAVAIAASCGAYGPNVHTRNQAHQPQRSGYEWSPTLDRSLFCRPHTRDGRTPSGHPRLAALLRVLSRSWLTRLVRVCGCRLR